MPISFVRVDDRVIHGQTMTRWAAARPCDAILVISDKVAGDALQKKVLKVAAGHFKLGIYTIEQGVSALDRARESRNDFFIISDSISQYANLVRVGGDFGSLLNIGNLTVTRSGTKRIGGVICLDDQDVIDLDYLASQGIEIQFQMDPDNSVVSWKEVKAKYEAL